MKNIHITANYKIRKKWIANRKPENYDKLTHYCVNSFQKNMIGVDESVVLKGECNTFHEVFQQVYDQIKTIYFDGGINLLWTDSDVFCIKETNLFEQFDDLNMFCHAKKFHFAFPGSVPNRLYKNLHPWFLSNVRYYPAELSDTLWNIGDKVANNWINVWAYECIIHNSMFHAQQQVKKLTPTQIKDKYHIPKYNYQLVASKGIHDDVKERDAHLVHLHSSRDIKRAIEYAKNNI